MVEPEGTETPLPVGVFTVTENAPVQLLTIVHFFLQAGTVRLVFAERVPVKTIISFDA